MRHIADSVEALLLVDMAHFAGLVAAGVHPSPIPCADIVTCTTTKTMRGPRGGLILSRDSRWSSKLQSAIFPGVQGSLHSQIIAAKAVCLGEALGDDFKVYARQVVENARGLGQTLSDRGIKLVSGGTDTHMLLLDFTQQKLKGQQVQDSLAQVNLTSNKNPVPFDSAKPSEWAGLRLGVAAATTRGLQLREFKLLGEIIARAINNIGKESAGQVRQDRQSVLQLCERFPIYG
jgi:glycine hydroxymethyltransferase